jgi:hypothetical protein
MFPSLNSVVAVTVLLSNGLAAFATPTPRQTGPVGTLHPIASSKKCADVRANAHTNGTAVDVFVFFLITVFTSLSDMVITASIAMLVPHKIGRFQEAQPRSS